jgi:predicted Zn-dependent protease
MKPRHVIALLVFLLFPLRAWGLSLDEESKYGREAYVQIAGSAKLYSDPYVCIQMAIIKSRLEAAVDEPFPIKLSIIDSSTLDAFAMVGGYVFITSGILEQADNEEEIAGVLGHEFSHVMRRHIAKELEKEKFLNWGMLGSMLLAMLIPSGAGKAAVMTAGLGGGEAVALKYSRENELEADKFGVERCEKAGYNGAGSAEFLKKIAASADEKQMPQYLLTHPYSEDRVFRIQQLASPMKTRLDVSFFPFVVARARILSGPLGAQNEDIWLKKYERAPQDPVSVYGAALVHSLKGDTDGAIALVKTLDSPYAPLFMGEFLVAGRRFKEAVAVLGAEDHPVARYFLAKAYEGQGNLAAAGQILKELTPYAGTFPEVYQRMGMVLGRQGNEAGGYEYLGRYYLETGRYKPAKVNLEKAVSKYGINSPEAEEILKILDTIKPDKEKKKEKQSSQHASLE